MARCAPNENIAIGRGAGITHPTQLRGAKMKLYLFSDLQFISGSHQLRSLA